MLRARARLSNGRNALKAEWCKGAAAVRRSLSNQSSDALFWLALGVLVRQHRRAKKLIQTDLQKQLGLSQPTVSRIEDGRIALDVLTFDRVLEWLGKTRKDVEQLADKMAACLKTLNAQPMVLSRVALKALGAFVAYVTP